MVSIGTGATPEQLLRRAHAELDEVRAEASLEQNFLHAHMAALRAGAALLALHPAPIRRRRAVRSVWEQIAELDDVWQRWAALFASGAPIRAAIETGRPHRLDERQVAHTEHAAAEFVGMVADAIETARNEPLLAS